MVVLVLGNFENETLDTTHLISAKIMLFLQLSIFIIKIKDIPTAQLQPGNSELRLGASSSSVCGVPQFYDGDNTRFLYKQRFFSTQPQYCLTFS